MESRTAECAREILDVAPLVMRAIRREMRSRRAPLLSVTQFRALVFLDRHPGATLSAMAEFLGLAPPTVCRMIDKLVAGGLVHRGTASADRRRIPLELTSRGQSGLEAARRGTLTWLSAQVGRLGPLQCGTVSRAMATLRGLFADGGKGAAR
jgi:DNA-binding MarR family transcriptional regulator